MGSYGGNHMSQEGLLSVCYELKRVVHEAPAPVVPKP